MLDKLFTVVLILAAASEFVIIVCLCVMFDRDVKNLKRKIDEVNKDLKQLDIRSGTQYGAVVDAIEDIEKRKVDRWDAGKTYWNTQDWDEHK